MRARVTVMLTQVELEALVHIAEQETRHPKEQMLFYLREDARRRGLLDQEALRNDRQSWKDGASYWRYRAEKIAHEYKLKTGRDYGDDFPE